MSIYAQSKSSFLGDHYPLDPNSASTDLLGIKAGTYEPNREDKNLRAALGPSCHEIRQVINRLGFRERANVRIYRDQNTQYFYDIQEFINSVQDIEVQLLEFSAKTIEDNFLNSLVFANSKIDLLVTHPDFAPNEYQKDKLRIAIQDLVSLKGRHPEPEKFQIKCYKQTASLRGRKFNNNLISVGWYTYDNSRIENNDAIPAIQKSKRHPKQIHGHINSMISVPLNTEYGKSISAMFDRVFKELWNSSESEYIEQVIEKL